jgi:hypothetical protein
MENEIMQQILFELKELKQGQTEMQSELTEIREELKVVKQGQAVLTDRVQSLENQVESVCNSQARVENNFEELGDRVQSVQNSQTTVELVWFPKINASFELCQNLYHPPRFWRGFLAGLRFFRMPSPKKYKQFGGFCQIMFKPPWVCCRSWAARRISWGD